MTEKLRPTPEQDLIEASMGKIDRISELLKMRPVYERFGMKDLVKKLQTADRLLDRIIRRELRKQAQEFVVFEAPKPPKKEVHRRKRKEKVKKSKGLKDSRPIEFKIPGKNKKVRGKEGRALKLLFGRGPQFRWSTELLAGRIFIPDDRVNPTIRRARKHLAGTPFDIVTKRDYAMKETFYSRVKRKPQRKR